MGLASVYVMWEDENAKVNFFVQLLLTGEPIVDFLYLPKFSSLQQFLTAVESSKKE